VHPIAVLNQYQLFFLGVTKAWETGGELRTRRSSIITPSKKMQDGPLRTPRYRLLDQWEACRRLSLLSASRKKEKTHDLEGYEPNFGYPKNFSFEIKDLRKWL
jgi:hypothetical protein